MTGVVALEPSDDPTEVRGREATDREDTSPETTGAAAGSDAEAGARDSDRVSPAEEDTSRDGVREPAGGGPEEPEEEVEEGAPTAEPDPVDEDDDWPGPPVEAVVAALPPT